MPRPGGGIQGNLIGPNSQIFQGGGRGGPGAGIGPFGPSGPIGIGGMTGLGAMGNHDPGMMSPGAMMWEPEGLGDLHPDLPG